MAGSSVSKLTVSLLNSGKTSSVGILEVCSCEILVKGKFSRHAKNKNIDGNFIGCKNKKRLL
jgi:hypothetical protein